MEDCTYWTKTQLTTKQMHWNSIHGIIDLEPEDQCRCPKIDPASNQANHKGCQEII
jgi:hypothetical protein